MTQDDGSRSAPDAFGRALWQRTKAAGRMTAPAVAARPVDDATIAAWLDGRLPEADAARVEQYLVERPQALQAALDTHNALADARRAPVPDRVVVRAQALVGFAAERRVSGGGLAGLFGGWRRALEMAAVGAAFVVVIAGGFSLGGFTQEAYAQSAQSREVAVELIINPLGAFNLPSDLDDLNEPGEALMWRKHLAWILLGLSMTLNVAFVGGFVHARYFAEPSPLAGLRPGSGPGLPTPIPTVNQRGPGPSPQELARELGLSDGQTRGLRQMIGEQRRRALPIVREMIQQRSLLVAELGKERPDPAIIEGALDRIGQLRTQLQKDGVQAALRFAESLPAEQRDRFRQVMVHRAMGAQGMPPGLRERRRVLPLDRK